MLLDFETLATRDAYAWMVSAITPRPIAWVSTINAAGQTNLAPFSFFQGVCASPPTLLFTGANDRAGKKKDTILNIEAVPEFVVSVVPFALAEPMNACATPLPHGESEFDAFKIASAPSAVVRPPRVAASPVSFECRLDRIVHVGEGPLAANVIFGRIVRMHVDESVLDAKGAIDPVKMDLIGRMGGDLYARTSGYFSITRPTGGGALRA